MPFNPYASPQAQDASRMPQVGFGQSNPSPQYGGMPNQNAFDNANPAANLTARFGTPAAGAPSPLPGGAPTSQPMGVPFGGRPTPQNYGGPMFSGQPPYGGQFGPMQRPYNRFAQFGGPNPMAFQYANAAAGLQNRFAPPMNYLPIMQPYGGANPPVYGMAPQYTPFNALLGPR